MANAFHVFKLCMEAQKRWRPLRGRHRIPQVISMQKFIDDHIENSPYSPFCDLTDCIRRRRSSHVKGPCMFGKFTYDYELQKCLSWDTEWLVRRLANMLDQGCATCGREGIQIIQLKLRLYKMYIWDIVQKITL